MLSYFVDKSGRVMVYDMCMKNAAGIIKDQVLDGIELSSGIAALLGDNITVLTY